MTDHSGDYRGPVTPPGRRNPLLVGCMVAMIGAFALLIIIAVAIGPRASGNVAIVEISGLILDSVDINRELDEYRENDSIKAVVLRVDSPGGEASPSQEIFRTVRRLDEEKPVIASMAGVAASGGYYVSLGARKIVANAATITGSIGVIVELANMKELLNWVKIRHEVIKSGPYKDIGSPLRDMKPDEREKLQAFVDDILDQFIGAVQEGRGMSRDEVEKVANGMIFTGRQAKELGLVDELGTLQDAVDLAAREAGIDKDEVEVIYPSPPNLMERLLGGDAGALEMIMPRSGVRAMYLFDM